MFYNNTGNRHDDTRSFFKDMYLIITLFIGILMAGLNIALYGFIAYPYFLLFPSFSLIVFSFFSCSGEDCWGAAVLAGSILMFLTTPLILYFLRYLIDYKSYPYNIKKFLIIIFIFIAVFLQIKIANHIAYFEDNALDYAMRLNIAESRNKKYSSIEECKISQPYNITGDCLGFFASLGGNINLCNEYLKDPRFTLSDKEYILVECISSYAINTDNIDICNQMEDESKLKCQAGYFIAKKDYDQCLAMKGGSWKKICLEETAYTKTDPKIIRYAELRGFLNKNKEENSMITSFWKFYNIK